MPNNLNPDYILDWQSEEERNTARGPKLEKGERILWKSAPMIEAMIEHPDWDKSRSRRLLYLLGVISIPLMVWGLSNWTNTGPIASIFLSLMVFCLVLVFKPPHFFFHRFLKYNKTYYTITDRKIAFYIDYGYAKELHELPWSEVRKLSYTPYREGMGTIHFVTKNAVNFTTYSFEDKEDRQFPSLELVPKGEQVFRLLQHFFKEYG